MNPHYRKNTTLLNLDIKGKNTNDYYLFCDWMNIPWTMTVEDDWESSAVRFASVSGVTFIFRA